MIQFSFSKETLLQHILSYFDNSLWHFRNHYLKLFLNDGDLIPIHKAYLCPLCISNFILILREEREVKATSDFDLDHYPQKSIGGNNTILVCKSCNNQAGHNFEFALKKHLELSSFGEKGSSHKVDIKSSIPNVGNFKGLIWKNENDQWELSLKPDEKVKIKPLDEWMEHSKKSFDWSIHITIPTPQDTHINKAMLKSAYLYCFALWGYEFAFSKTGELIREVLSGKAEYPMAVLPLKFNQSSPNFTRMPRGVCFISYPEELRSFVVNILVKDKSKGLEAIHPVFIPNPSITGIDELKKIQRLMNEKITGEINMVHLNGILHSTPYAYSQTWKQMKEL